jgi:hypothetical protein
MTLEEMIERGLQTDKYGRVLDEYGNEYRDEDGCVCYIERKKNDSNKEV